MRYVKWDLFVFIRFKSCTIYEYNNMHVNTNKIYQHVLLKLEKFIIWVNNSFGKNGFVCMVFVICFNV
jgi:hypothetical protein